MFNFDEVEDMVDVGRGFVIEKVTEFVKNNLKNHISMPIKYIKSSWYIKEKDGWEKCDTPNNKAKMPCSTDYSHNLIVKKFLFIIQNRFMGHFDNVDPEWKCQPETQSARRRSCASQWSA